MRIMIDTNVMISAIIFPGSLPDQAVQKTAVDHTIVLCAPIIEELERIFEKKFPDKKSDLKGFLDKLSYESVKTSQDLHSGDYPEIRDPADLPILAAAVDGAVDIILTGDKDFKALDIKRPKILNPAEFVERH